MKRPLGKEVDLGPGHIVLDGYPAPPSRERSTTAASLFGPCLLWPFHGRPSELLLSSCSILFCEKICRPNIHTTVLQVDGVDADYIKKVRYVISCCKYVLYKIVAGRVGACE